MDGFLLLLSASDEGADSTSNITPQVSKQMRVKSKQQKNCHLDK